jgi:pimeloyl-ACP methyl ester carboxylesterase
MGPETRYAKSGGVHIAYQVTGSSPRDLTYVPGAWSHVEWCWEHPFSARFLNRLASFSRFILFDKRGTGLSDRVADTALPSLEQRMDDVRAVLDAAGSKRTALFGISEGAAMSCLFAATYPERTSALILYGGFPRFTWAADYPYGFRPELVAQWIKQIEEGWGKGVSLPFLAPDLAADEEFKEWWARGERLGASPGSMLALLAMALEIDIRALLSVIRVPTLIIHRTEDTFIPVEGARYLARQIPGARLVELPGREHEPFLGNAEAVLDEIEEFLTGVRQGPVPDRVLATVMFTDIVESTARAAAAGDRQWRDLLSSYYTVARREVTRFRGREIDTAGDGYFAAFDGPARAIRCALAIRDSAPRLGIAVRAGLHTGECETFGDKITGIAVHIGARVAALAGPGEVLVSSTVKDLVAGSGLGFSDRGLHGLKGIPAQWRVFAAQP